MSPPTDRLRVIGSQQRAERGEPNPSIEPGDDASYLALMLAEIFRLGLSLLGKRWPDARTKTTCPKCGHRHI